MRNVTNKLFVALFAAGLMLTLLALPGQAQRRGRGGYRAPEYTKGQIETIIRRVENRSDEFVRLFDKSLDRSRLDGTRREDRLNEQARDLERDLDSLRRDFDRTDRYTDTRAQVSRVLNTASGINQVVSRRRLGGDTERQWSLVRVELNALADAYNLRQLRRYGS